MVEGEEEACTLGIHISRLQSSRRILEEWGGGYGPILVFTIANFFFLVFQVFHISITLAVKCIVNNQLIPKVVYPKARYLQKKSGEGILMYASITLPE